MKMINDEEKPTILQESAEPGVIDQKMLVALIIDQGPKNEAGRLFVEDGINLDEVTEIRIEFLNILNIDHLWLMRNLVNLKLSNNKIEKIANLDVLINLKELDLSFNNIEVMENLNHLKSLEILLLYQNQISVIQGIDDLKEITILSIGNNNVNDWKHVMYLRKLRNLRSLNVAGNPCAEQEGYLNYLFAFIPQLVYFQYKMITERERQIATDEHYRAISNLLEEEAKEQEELNRQAAFEENVALLSISYVEYLDGDYMFNKMFERDKEGNSLLTLCEDARSAHAEYKVKFMELCKDLYELGLAEQIRRSKEIKMFEDLVTKGEDDIQKESQAMMDEIMERKAEILSDVKELIQSITEELEADVLDEKLEKARRLSEEFSDLVARTWTRLMHKEVVLHEQMEDINEVFKLHMTDMVASFLEAAQNIFSLMRNLEAEYNDNIAGIASIVLNAYQTTEDNKMSPSMTEIIGDKDILSNNLGASHDLHLQIIDGREDRLTSRLNGWLEGKIEKLVEDESTRNRQKILEISHFLECQREEFDALQLRRPLHSSTENSDIAAVLES